MVEIHRRDGIEWHLTRVLLSQPYVGASILQHTAKEVHENLDLNLTVVNMAWYHPTATLGVYTPRFPLTFRDFRRTFRYWMISNVEPTDTVPMYKFRSGVLPSTVAPPTELFFDLLRCGNISNVVLGLHPLTAHEAWDALPSHMGIDYDTFVFLWSAYRASLWWYKTPVLLVILFVAKLLDQAKYRPGRGHHLRLKEEWNTL